jgi:hypothetical protein
LVILVVDFADLMIRIQLADKRIDRIPARRKAGSRIAVRHLSLSVSGWLFEQRSNDVRGNPDQHRYSY